MSFFHSKGFKYVKNLIIGVGAAVVLTGALFKIESWKGASLMLTIGLLTEAGLFLMLGVLGPETDYYWEKLYPGLDEYGGTLAGVTPISNSKTPSKEVSPLDGAKVEGLLSTMVSHQQAMTTNQQSSHGELQTMAKSLSSLKALQEVDFSKTGEQVKKMGDFYANLNAAMIAVGDSVEDAKRFKEQLSALNGNLGSLNNVYGGMLSAMAGAAKR